MNERMPTIKSLEELEQVVGPDRYLRVSSGPDEDAGATSRDYESGLDLPGLSVDPLAPAAWWSRPLQEWLARQMCPLRMSVDRTSCGAFTGHATAQQATSVAQSHILQG